MDLMVNTDASVSDPTSCESRCLQISLMSHILPGQLGFSSDFWKSIWSKETQTWLVCGRFDRNTPKATSQMIKRLKVKLDKNAFISLDRNKCVEATPSLTCGEDVAFVKQDSSCRRYSNTVGHASLIHLWKSGEGRDGANNPKSTPFSPPPPHTLYPLSSAGFHPTLTPSCPLLSH